MISYGQHNLDNSDYQAVLQTLKSSHLTQGPKVPAFETALCKATGARYAVAVSSGTAALHLSYLAAGLKPKDEIITTPNTFVATTNMALTLGVKPVFADINPNTYNLDENKIESLITPRTKAIVPVHFAGHPCHLNKIWQLAKKHNLTVIEDAAHALGSLYKNKPLGQGKSSMIILSFHPVKLITTGEGGAILTNNKKLYNRLKLLRQQGVSKDSKGFNVMTELGYNYRLADINAALGLSQLTKLNKFTSARRQIVNWYQTELSNLSQIILPTETPYSKSSWHLYVIRTQKPSHRLPLYNYLKKQGIGVNFHYPPVYSHPYYKNHGYKNVSLPTANNYASTAITLPIHPTLTKTQVKFICHHLKKFFS